MITQKTLMSGLGIAWILVVAAVAVIATSYLETALDDYQSRLSEVSQVRR